MLKSASSLAKRLLLNSQSFRLCSSTSSSPVPAVVHSEDEPVVLESNPYTKEPRKCLLCSTGVELDYKNSRLLQVYLKRFCQSSIKSFQQFVSTFSGRVYDRHITGLCDEQQKKLIEAIAVCRSRNLTKPLFTFFRNLDAPDLCPFSWKIRNTPEIQSCLIHWNQSDHIHLPNFFFLFSRSLLLFFLIENKFVFSLQLV